MATQKVNISIATDYLSRFAEVVSRCKSVGLIVEQELDIIGVISGTIDAQRIPALRSVEGIAAVEEDQTFQLPPTGDEPL